MLIIRKKNIIIGLLVVLLIVTGYLNFVFNQNLAPAVSPVKDKSPVENDKDNIDNEAGMQDDDKDNQETSGGKVTVTDLDDNTGSEEDDDVQTAASGSSTFFRDYRFERQKERAKEIEYINSIVNNPNSDEDMIKEAQAQLLEITSNMEAELVIENLIKAKGFNDAVVMIHKDNVNVIVDKAELVPEEVAIILDIVKRESGKETGNIKIIPKI
ncbi:MAG TPA: SpoIIIAH-like family protein [Clostridiales bacterium]|nr:SpoIIIAH-like family protein [Clostridiales bacterium]